MSGEKDMKETLLPFNQHLEHLIRGHQNAQETIRAMDTKTSILVAIAGGLSTIINSSANQISSGNLVTDLILKGAVLFGIASAFLCLFSLIARPPKGTLELPAYILFPFIVKGKKIEDEQLVYLREKSLTGMADDDVKKEYSEQLMILGYILEKKIGYNRMAIRMFMIQLVLLTLEIAL